MKTQNHILMGGLILLLIAGYIVQKYNLVHTLLKIDREAEEIARMHCGSCHQFTSPELLDKATWKSQVLPEMGRRLGIQSLDYDPFDGLPESEADIIRYLQIYPDTPMLSEKEWDTIVDYYLAHAPENLEKATNMHFISESKAPFLPHFIEIDEKEIPQVTLLHYDTLQNVLYIGDNDILYALNSWGDLIGRWSLPAPATDFQVLPDGQKAVLTIGSITPSELQQGALLVSAGGFGEPFYPVLENLPRPVHFSITHLDNDGLEDVIVSEFGHHRGALTWYSGMKEPNILKNVPGARITFIRDMNQDGLPDIVALMTQALECVDIYYNQGNGQYHRETVLAFSPIHGVCYLELADFDDDGYYDLLITNGDNWDYSTIDKPYHGIRIYMNDGSNQFEETMFYPMNGSSKAIARDFDQDGDLDIAAIAFYNKAENPENGFIYLENSGNWTFTGYYLPEAAGGKWLVMEVGDFDQDGYDDLFLGSYFHNVAEWTKLASHGMIDFPEVLYLMNTSMTSN